MTAEPSAIDTWLTSASTVGPSPGEFISHDGARLAFTGFRSSTATSRTALVYLHGIESHARWFDAPARLLQQQGYGCFCLDRRGSGVNREHRGFHSGDVDSYQTLIDDIHAFRATLSGRFDHVYLIGLSWGGKLGTAYILQHPEDFDGLILITPGLSARVDVSIIEKVGIFLSLLLSPSQTFKIPIKPEMFTNTPRFLELIRNDPLRLSHATARFLYESRKLDRYVAHRISGCKLPILLFLAGHDQIIDNVGVCALLSRAGESELDIHMYGGLQHSLQFEAAQRLVTDVVSWIGRRE